jgi:hypothetical protein
LRLGSVNQSLRGRLNAEDGDHRQKSAKLQQDRFQGTSYGLKVSRQVPVDVTRNLRAVNALLLQQGILEMHQ